MSHGARSLYTAIKRRYNANNHNNGRLWLSTRDAAKEIGSSSEEIVNWFRELQHYGFIVMMQPGRLGVEGKGKAPHWRLTELGYMHDAPTRDFMRWDGTKYRRVKKQNPVAEIRYGVLRKSATPSLRNPATLTGQSAAESRCIYEHPSAAENRNILSIPLPSAQSGDGSPTSALSYDPDDGLGIPEILRRH
jgi:hypothetical protein